MLVRYIYCTLLLAAFLWALNFVLEHSFAPWGFWPGMAVCIIGTAIVIAVGFAWDRL